MVDVAFHSGVADKLGYACRLARKICRQGEKAIVVGETADMARLDPLLWTFDPGEFITHARWRPGTTVGAELRLARIWLVDAGTAAPPGGWPARVLVNLSRQLPADVNDFDRVVEVVAAEPEDRQAGRQRWRAYESAGAKLTHHPQEGVPT